MMLYNKLQYLPREFVKFTHEEQVLNKTEDNISDTSMSYMKNIRQRKNKILSIQDQDPVKNDLIKKQKEKLDNPYGSVSSFNQKPDQNG